MKKILIISLFAIAACNSSSDSKNPASESRKTQASTWTTEGENELMAGCVDQAKARLGEDTAYMYCKCALQQVKKEYPNMDSATTVLMDSSRVAELTKNCK
jgi:outer membrane protein assembly factor BamD (BamD/ComL family)